MTLDAASWGFDGKSYDGDDMRMLAEAGWGHNGIAQTPGFLNGFKASAQASPNATVSVAAGKALIKATAAGQTYSYITDNDAALASPSFAATSGNPRWDYLILRVTAGVPALEIVQGTASGSPVAPTITGDNYLPISLVKIPASQSTITSGMVNDARTFTGKWNEPWGIVDYVVNSTPHANVSSATFATSTKTYVANRRIKVSGYGVVQLNSGGAILNVTLFQAGNQIANSGFTVGTNGWFVTCSPSIVVTPPAGSVTFSCAMSASSGNMTLSDSSSQPAFMLIEDIGPNGNPD